MEVAGLAEHLGSLLKQHARLLQPAGIHVGRRQLRLPHGRLRSPAGLAVQLQRLGCEVDGLVHLAALQKDVRGHAVTDGQGRGLPELLLI